MGIVGGRIGYCRGENWVLNDIKKSDLIPCNATIYRAGEKSYRLYKLYRLCSSRRLTTFSRSAPLAESLKPKSRSESLIYASLRLPDLLQKRVEKSVLMKKRRRLLMKTGV